MKDAEKNEKKKPDYGFIIGTVFITLAVFALYETLAVQLEYGFVFWIYYAMTPIVFIAYAVYNRGLAWKKVKDSDLPADWSPEAKAEFIAEVATRKKNSRFLLALGIAFVFTFLFDTVELFFPSLTEPIKQVMSSWLR